jgi:hypothetical protein
VGAPPAPPSTLAAAASSSAGNSVEPSSYILEAYPNPSKGAFQVRLATPVEGPAQVEIFDLQGRRLRTVFDGTLAAGAPREVTVTRLELAPGLYQLRMRSGGHQQWQRLIIQ